MELIADIILAIGAAVVSIYCYSIARRLARFNDLDSGVGQAIALLSAQVDDLSRILTSVQEMDAASSATLTDLIDRAETAAKRLELMVAAMHDLPAEDEAQPKEQTAPPEPVFSRRSSG